MLNLQSSALGGRRRRRSTRKGQVRKTARRAYMKVGRKTRKSGGKRRRGRKSKRC